MITIEKETPKLKFLNNTEKDFWKQIIFISQSEFDVSENLILWADELTLALRERNYN